MQVDDVGLLEFGQGADVGAGIGYVDGKEVVLLEVVGAPDDHALPKELDQFPPRPLQLDHADLVGLFVPHQHLGLDAVVS